jgi:hypothetical protein
MKGFILFLIIGALSYLAGWWYPWWSIAIVAFVISLIVPQKPLAAFLTAFIAIFVFWFSLAFFQDLANDHILSSRISELFLHVDSPLGIAAVSGLIGGLVAGMAALSASFLRYRKKAPKRVGSYYSL